MHCGDAAVRGHRGFSASQRIVVRTRNERAIDVDLVVALAEHDVEDFDGRTAAVQREQLVIRIARRRVVDEAD